MRARQAIGIALLVLATVCEAAQPLRARHETVGVTRVLWIEGSVDAGSANRVRGAIARIDRYDEIWLNSGGGSVLEGMALGRALRKHAAGQRVVRVPGRQGVLCASSCTLAMLGGKPRRVDSEAMFIVHSMSGVATELGGLDIDKPINLSDPEVAARGLVAYMHRKSAAYWQFLLEVAIYVQEMLVDTAATDGSRQVLRGLLPPRAYEGGDRSAELDIGRIQYLGLRALEELLTQVELGAARHAIDALRHRSFALGSGMPSAIRILERMLECRISDACQLNAADAADLLFSDYESK